MKAKEELKELKQLVKTYLDKRDELHSQNNGMNFTSKLIITDLEEQLKQKVNV